MKPIHAGIIDGISEARHSVVAFFAHFVVPNDFRIVEIRNYFHEKTEALGKTQRRQTEVWMEKDEY